MIALNEQKNRLHIRCLCHVTQTINTHFGNRMNHLYGGGCLRMCTVIFSKFGSLICSLNWLFYHKNDINVAFILVSSIPWLQVVSFGFRMLSQGIQAFRNRLSVLFGDNKIGDRSPIPTAIPNHQGVYCITIGC